MTHCYESGGDGRGGKGREGRGGEGNREKQSRVYSGTPSSERTPLK